MVRLFKQVFIVLLGFSRSLRTKCVPLSNEPYIFMLTFIGLNSAELLS